jgi:hypothetical protein
MPRPPSQAQIANQVTFLLKGDLKNARIAYIRAAVRLAQVRDQKLWQALKFRSLEEYAAKRLPLQKTRLRRSHPGWLVRRPKGFIPELSDADALMWLESRLEDPHLSDALRREVEAMRKKALIGYLTEREFRALQSSGRKREVTLRGLFTRLGSLRRLAARVPQCPAPLIAGLDSAIRAAEAALGAARHVAALKGVDLRMVRAA